MQGRRGVKNQTILLTGIPTRSRPADPLLLETLETDLRGGPRPLSIGRIPKEVGRADRARCRSARRSHHRRARGIGPPQAKTGRSNRGKRSCESGLCAAMWGRVIPHLVESYRVVAPDQPGLGQSEVRAGTLDAAAAVGWLGDLVARTCAERASGRLLPCPGPGLW
jgi:hypothetical protein